MAQARKAGGPARGLVNVRMAAEDRNIIDRAAGWRARRARNSWSRRRGAPRRRRCSTPISIVVDGKTFERFRKIFEAPARSNERLAAAHESQGAVGELRPLSAPELLTGHHQIDGFDCGEQLLDDWLRRRALANQASGASRVFVVCGGERVVGYYAWRPAPLRLVRRRGACGATCRIPSRFSFSDGSRLIASSRETCSARSCCATPCCGPARPPNSAGSRGCLFTHLSEEAKRFYLRHGFVDAPSSPLTLVARLKDLTE